MVVATAVSAAAHADDPAREGHLVVDLAKRRRHLVGERAADDHDVGLPGRGTEDDAEPVLVVARSGNVPSRKGEDSMTSSIIRQLASLPEPTDERAS